MPGQKVEVQVRRNVHRRTVFQYTGDQLGVIEDLVAGLPIREELYQRD